MVPMELVQFSGGDAALERPDNIAAQPAVIRLSLTAVEKKSVEELVTGAAGTTAVFVAERAAALAADNDGQVRRRSLSKAAAVQEALVAQLTALLAVAVTRRDSDAVKFLDRALSGSTKRFSLLIEELRAEISGGRRAVVQVAVANNVNIDAG